MNVTWQGGVVPIHNLESNNFGGHFKDFIVRLGKSNMGILCQKMCFPLCPLLKRCFNDFVFRANWLFA